MTTIRANVSRRSFLKYASASAVAFACSGRLFSIVASAAENKPFGAKLPEKPPNTCGGWFDKAQNGICDRSEPDPGKPACGRRECPANKNNPKRDDLKKNGAPDGVCAIWEDGKKAGFCAISVQKDKPCNYTLCPAHKNTRKKTKKIN
jgi:hypothetical protein